MKKKLYKKKNGAMICGGLNGFADFLGVDASVVRLVYIILGLFVHSFPAIILYILLAVIMPSSNETGYTDYDIM